MVEDQDRMDLVQRDPTESEKSTVEVAMMMRTTPLLKSLVRKVAEMEDVEVVEEMDPVDLQMAQPLLIAMEVEEATEMMKETAMRGVEGAVEDVDLQMDPRTTLETVMVEMTITTMKMGMMKMEDEALPMDRTLTPIQSTTPQAVPRVLIQEDHRRERVERRGDVEVEEVIRIWTTKLQMIRLMRTLLVVREKKMEEEVGDEEVRIRKATQERRLKREEDPKEQRATEDVAMIKKTLEVLWRPEKLFMSIRMDKPDTLEDLRDLMVRMETTEEEEEMEDVVDREVDKLLSKTIASRKLENRDMWMRMDKPGTLEGLLEPTEVVVSLPETETNTMSKQQTFGSLCLEVIAKAEIRILIVVLHKFIFRSVIKILTTKMRNQADRTIVVRMATWWIETEDVRVQSDLEREKEVEVEEETVEVGQVEEDSRTRAPEDDSIKKKKIRTVEDVRRLEETEVVIAPEVIHPDEMRTKAVEGQVMEDDPIDMGTRKKIMITVDQRQV